MKADEIANILNHFVASPYNKVLIKGGWGIGKTKYVSEFLLDHSNFCYVSLFGKRDVNSIIQEIYFRIIEKAPRGKVKKFFSQMRESMNTLDISIGSFSLSIPVIENLHNSLNKELQRGTFIIVLDDLERKHEDLDIKEIFGVVDNLSNIENTKVILIAATEQLEEKDKATFENYHEKAIDRTYFVDKFADKAPEEILGNSIWGVIGNLAVDFNFTNLRTFEKTSSFITEVLQVLGEDIFTEKFTREDLYRMCFATVFFTIEHKGEMKLLSSGDESGTNFMRAYYTDSKSGVIEYLSNYILRNSLDNELSKNVFYHLKKWFETGTFSKDTIIKEISFINNHKEQLHNFFSSDQDLADIIYNVKNHINNLDGSENISELMYELNIAFTWSEILSIDFDINNKEIIDLLSSCIIKNIDISKNIEENLLDDWKLHLENVRARELFKLVNEKIQVDYYQLLIARIKNSFNQKEFSEFAYLKNLIEMSTQNNLLDFIKEDLLENLNTNEYFLPIPAGRINEDQWRWCQQVKKLIITIEKCWNLENYFKNFKEYFYNLEISNNDKMLQHRLNQLFERNY